MKTQEKLPITRKTAIYKAISLLEKQSNREEEIAILRELATGVPILQWSEKIVKDCIDNFYLENRRLPTVTDFQKKNEELPPYSSIKHLFGVTASRWLSKYAQSYEPPKTTRKKTLILVLDLLEGEEKKHIQDMLNEYPITKWNEINTINCIVSFYETYNRVPTQDEIVASKELPYYEIFKYKWKTTYLNWLEEHIPILYEKYKEQCLKRRDYVSEFVSEYKRIRPKSSDDFNRRRNGEICCSSDHIERQLNIKGWVNLVKYCGLEPIDFEEERIAKERAKIKSVRRIIVDCGENFFFREYSKILEKKYLQ